MKKITILLIILCYQFSFAQTNYYSFNTDSLFDEATIHSSFDTLLSRLPDNILINPTIYHRVIKGDSIINYISFSTKKVNIDTLNLNIKFQQLDGDSVAEYESNFLENRNKFEFSFHQDPLFLFLNKKLPHFKLPDLNGSLVSSNQLNGKPSLLNYWAITCRPCVAEIPELNKLKKRYQDKVNFIAITESACEKGEVEKFLLKKPFNFRILLNGDDYKKTLNIQSIPVNIFVDKDGYIRYIQRNYPMNDNKYFEGDNYFKRIIEELIK